MENYSQIYAINDMFDHISIHKPDWNDFYKLLGRKWFHNFPQIWTYDVILAPKMTQIWEFSPKMTYFDQIYAINDMFDHISVHKPDGNNF